MNGHAVALEEDGGKPSFRACGRECDAAGVGVPGKLQPYASRLGRMRLCDKARIMEWGRLVS